MTPLHEMKFLQTEPADVYHAKAKDNLSSHQLMTFMQSPLMYWKKRSGLITEPESTAYFVGRATHTRILEGRDVYEREYAIGGPINPSTGKPFGSTTKKFMDWQESQNKPVIPFEKAELIENMHSGVMQNPYARQLLETGIAEGVVRLKYRDLPSQIRIDWFNPDHGIADLKTCDNLHDFAPTQEDGKAVRYCDAARFKYHHQAAFYQSVLAEAIGEMVPFYLIAVEKREPFACGVWRITDESLAHARGEINAAIERLKKASAKDEWVSGYEELQYLSII
ncbi:MAG: PD-(D/E)XK nuclease-like domain-containing protein [Thermoguttaceae bacterium]